MSVEVEVFRLRVSYAANDFPLFNKSLPLPFYELMQFYNINFSEIKERNNSIDDVREQLRNEMKNHKDVHKQEFADISNEFNTIKKTTNKSKSSGDLTVSAEKSYREYFTTTLNELKTKVRSIVFCFQTFSNLL